MQRAAAQSHSLDAVRAHYRRLAPDYDRKANATCKAAYRELVGRVFASSQSVLELGAGSSPLVTELSAPRKVVCDLSADMFNASPMDSRTEARAVADAQHLPFADASFDGVFSINLLEHLPDPSLFAYEAFRVLRPGGHFLAVTPNGDLEWLLNALERLHLKLPEGPHKFLRTRDLADLSGGFRHLEHCRFLSLPIGPWPLVRLIDRAVVALRTMGFFHYILLEKSTRNE